MNRWTLGLAPILASTIRPKFLTVLRRVLLILLLGMLGGPESWAESSKPTSPKNETQAHPSPEDLFRELESIPEPERRFVRNRLLEILESQNKDSLDLFEKVLKSSKLFVQREQLTPFLKLLSPSFLSIALGTFLMYRGNPAGIALLCGGVGLMGVSAGISTWINHLRSNDLRSRVRSHWLSFLEYESKIARRAQESSGNKAENPVPSRPPISLEEDLPNSAMD